jgi:hypothetical protein
MKAYLGKIVLFILCLLSFAAKAQMPQDSIFGRDTSIVDVYKPRATLDNFKLLKQEVATLGIGSSFACQGYYGIFYMCELPPYVIGGANYNSRWCNIQYKISGNDSVRANLVLITAEIHNPDYQLKTLEAFVDVIRKTMNMMGEVFPADLRSSILDMREFKIRTSRGYVLRLKVYHTQFDALEIKIDATGIE